LVRSIPAAILLAMLLIPFQTINNQYGVEFLGWFSSGSNINEITLSQKGYAVARVTANASVNGIVTASVLVDYQGGSSQKLGTQDYNVQLNPGQSILIIVDFMTKDILLFGSLQPKGFYMTLAGAVSWQMPNAYPPRLPFKGIIGSTTMFSTNSISSTSTISTRMALPPIPGFPWESIIAGLMLGLAVLAIVRRRHRITSSHCRNR